LKKANHGGNINKIMLGTTMGKIFGSAKIRRAICHYQNSRKEERRRRVEGDECTNSLGRNLTSEYVQTKTSIITQNLRMEKYKYIGNSTAIKRSYQEVLTHAIHTRKRYMNSSRK
jgi:hypothetical protein